MVTKESDLIHTKPKTSLCTDCFVHLANEIHEVAANKPFEMCVTKVLRREEENIQSNGYFLCYKESTC